MLYTRLVMSKNTTNRFMYLTLDPITEKLKTVFTNNECEVDVMRSNTINKIETLKRTAKEFGEDYICYDLLLLQVFVTTKINPNYVPSETYRSFDAFSYNWNRIGMTEEEHERGCI